MDRNLHAGHGGPLSIEETELVEESEVEIVREEPSGDDATDDLLSMLDELGERAPTIDLRRRNPRTGKLEFLDNLSPEEFDLGLVAERFGGGDYQARAKDDRGRFVSGGTRSFVIAGRPKTPERDPEPPDVEADRTGGDAELFRDLFREVRDELRAIRSAPREDGDTRQLAMDMVKAMQEASKTGFEQARQLFEGRDQGLSPSDVLDLLQQGMELGQRVGGGSGDVVSDLGRELIGVFRKANAGGGMGGQSGAGPQQGATQRPPSPPADPSAPGWVNLVGRYMPQLMQLARLGRDPAAYSVVLLDQLPPAAVDVLERELARGDFLQRFMARFPQAGEHAWWFESLTEELHAQLVGDQESSPESEGDTA